jgi:hypothetical protein
VLEERIVAIHYDPNRDAQIALTGTINTGTGVSDPDPGSGALLTPGSGMGTKSRSGSGMNIPEHISESLETVFWGKNTLIRIRDPETS